MSVQAPNRPRLAGDDFDGTEQFWNFLNASIDGLDESVVADMERRRQRNQSLGRAGLSGDGEYVPHQRRLPAYVTDGILRENFEGPENYLG